MFTSRTLWAGKLSHPIFFKKHGSDYLFCGLWLSPSCWWMFTTSWTWSVPAAISPELPHTLYRNGAGERIFTFTKGREGFFSPSKITVLGCLTLQVLLIWTVSSLGGFLKLPPPPHHPFLPRPTPANINRDHTSRIFCLYHRKTTDLGMQQLGGHNSLSESSGVLAKWNPCDENDQI